MTQDEFFDIALDSEARSEIARAIPASSRAFFEERTGTVLMQHELFEWMDELTL
jgi:hypothetical protein